jgi:hypothetical protein
MNVTPLSNTNHHYWITESAVQCSAVLTCKLRAIMAINQSNCFTVTNVVGICEPGILI